MSIGAISVRCSFFIYLFMLVPQIVLNVRRDTLAGFSWGTHLALLFSGLCDTLYALNNQMPWQYYSIGMTSSVLLGVQHLQFWLYHRQKLPTLYRPITVALIAFLIAGVIGLVFFPQAKTVFFTLGYVSVVCNLSASLPQIAINRRLQSTEGLSLIFVILQTLGLVCDTISAYSLNWGYPNKIGSPCALALQLVVCMQFWSYRRRQPTRGDTAGGAAADQV